MSKIFLVDDQPISNFITKKLLELEGYNENINDFTNPEEAFEIVKSEENALIFLDLNMPVMTGWDFLDALKSHNINHHRIIILTSSTSMLDQQKAKEYPCVIKYMEKPMNKQKFSEITEHLKAS